MLFCLVFSVFPEMTYSLQVNENFIHGNKRWHKWDGIAHQRVFWPFFFSRVLLIFGNLPWFPEDICQFTHNNVNEQTKQNGFGFTFRINLFCNYYCQLYVSVLYCFVMLLNRPKNEWQKQQQQQQRNRHNSRNRFPQIKRICSTGDIEIHRNIKLCHLNKTAAAVELRFFSLPLNVQLFHLIMQNAIIKMCLAFFVFFFCPSVCLVDWHHDYSKVKRTQQQQQQKQQWTFGARLMVKFLLIYCGTCHIRLCYIYNDNTINILNCIVRLSRRCRCGKETKKKRKEHVWTINIEQKPI